MITEIYLDAEMPDSPITYCAYKVKHPLQRIMTLRMAIREGAVGDPAAIARKVIADAASRARTIFEGLAQGWQALVGVGASSSNVAVTVEKEEAPELDG
jgi:DNA-directed RNA polymerase subunit L